MIADWDDAYANAPYIADSQAFPARWAKRAADARANLGGAGRVELDLQYGPKPRHRMDLFHPERKAKGLLVFVHGGYWMTFDKTSWSHLALGALSRDWAVAIPSYTLAPNARISAITVEIAHAIVFAAQRFDGLIHLAGHSAGGHLAVRQICASSPMLRQFRERIKRVVSISGLYDLRPLLRTRMNATLKLDMTEAVAESAALDLPAGVTPVTAWVGGDERPEFIRQTDLIANIWSGLGADVDAVRAPGRHHFDVIDDMVDPRTELARLCAP